MDIQIIVFLIYLLTGFILACIGSYLFLKHGSDITEEGIGGVFLFLLFLWPAALILIVVFSLCLGLGKFIRKIAG